MNRGKLQGTAVNNPFFELVSENARSTMIVLHMYEPQMFYTFYTTNVFLYLAIHEPVIVKII